MTDVPAVAVRGLRQTFGDVVALEDVTFDVPVGQVVALLGPNGAGKTTLTDVMAGLTRPTRGAVTTLGVNPAEGGRRWRSRVALVTQATALDAQLTVGEMVRAFRAAQPRARSVSEVLGLVDLADRQHARIATLSGGQRRRVDLALGFLGHPDLVFLDEPTTGLDPHARRQVWRLVRAEAAGGATVLLTTHYLDEAEQLADRVLVLSSGRLVADARPDVLRGRSALTMIRCRMAPDTPVTALLRTLPAVAAQAGELLLPSREPARDLRLLLDWAEAHGANLHGLEVAPPSLEDAYLALTEDVVQEVS